MEHALKKDNDSCSVELTGRFTFIDHSAFKALIDKLLAENIKHCDLDLSGLEFVDSAGLGMLLILKDELAKKSIQLKLRAPQGQVDKMLKVSNFDQMFTIEK